MAAVGLAGCGQDTSSSAKATQQAQEIVKPSSQGYTLTPSDEVKPDTREVGNAYFTMRVPAAFQEKEPKDNPPSVFFEPPRVPPQDPVRLYVVADTHPRSSAEEQSYVAQIAAQGQDVVVQRSSVSWPGAERAVILRISRPRGAEPAGAASVPVVTSGGGTGSPGAATGSASSASASATTGASSPAAGHRMVVVQIFAQVNDNLIVNCVAYGPEGEMDSSGLTDALRSFRPKAG